MYRYRTRGRLHGGIESWHHRLREEKHLITFTICMKDLCALTSLYLLISLESTFVDMIHNTLANVVHNQGDGSRNCSQCLRMTNVIGVDSVHGLV